MRPDFMKSGQDITGKVHKNKEDGGIRNFLPWRIDLGEGGVINPSFSANPTFRCSSATSLLAAVDQYVKTTFWGKNSSLSRYPRFFEAL
ncbi:hypothetical protein Pfo_001040 [Paulownia fortunei]|nr:hypothetical protein Pfo_001040 [Paulownia fortunei]